MVKIAAKIERGNNNHLNNGDGCPIREGSDSSQLSLCVIHTHSECVSDSYPWAPSVWPPVSEPRLGLEGQSWQGLHRPQALVSTWGPVSSAYQKHSLHVSCVSPILSLGLVGWEKAFHSYLFSAENEGRRGVAIALATQLHSVPLFDWALGRLLPQLHHGGGVCTNTQNQIKQAY